MEPQSPVDNPLKIGDTLGKYRVTEKLGEGGMGVVYGGVHEALGRPVAIKLLRSEFARNDTVLGRFQQEAEAVSRIGHAHIVAVYDFGRTPDGAVYYVMERIPGETLTRRMRREPLLEAPEIAAVFGQICRALQATHSRNIVHRDMKPDNILLQSTESGPPHVKLVDFGVAKMREDQPLGEAGAAAGEGANFTQSGTLLGTPTYMAPEQVTSVKSVDGRADLYALGAILYEVLTGQPPFGRGQLIEILTRHVREAVVPPSQRSPLIPVSPALDAFLLKALAKRPEERQPDAATFATELEAALGIERSRTGRFTPVPAAGSATPVFTPPPVAAARRWPWAVGLALALAGGGAALLVTRRHAPPPPRVTVLVESPLRLEAGRVVDGALAGDAAQRREALEALAEVADRSSVDRLVTALGDDNPEVRRAAAVAAAAIGRPDDAALRRALDEAAGRSGGAVAVDLAAARLQLGAADAGEQLRQALALRDGAARLRAAVALADASQLPAPPLRAALQAAPPTVRRRLRWSAYGRLVSLGDQAFIAEARAALAGPDPVARLDAAQALARQKDSAGLLALAAIAKSAADPVDRVDAAQVEAELGDTGARDALLAALGDAAPSVRARAAAALGRLAPSIPDGGPLARELSALLHDGEAGPRIAAAAALLALPDTALSTPTPPVQQK